MKKILLLGDSIRLGYEGYVKEKFSGIAEIYSPKENCAFAQYMLRWLYEWKIKEGYPDDIDLVHWNVGAWDVLRILGDDTFTSVEYYAETLKRLFVRIKTLFPKAKQIFATCTSGIDELYEPPYQRCNADIEKFNQAAIETLLPLGVVINDLYPISKNASKECRSDMTHFSTPQGVELLGAQVVKSLCDQLEIDEKTLNEIKTVAPEIDERILGR